MSFSGEGVPKTSFDQETDFNLSQTVQIEKKKYDVSLEECDIQR